jgi:hypothetical protein
MKPINRDHSLEQGKVSFDSKVKRKKKEGQLAVLSIFVWFILIAKAYGIGVFHIF